MNLNLVSEIKDCILGRLYPVFSLIVNIVFKRSNLSLLGIIH